MCWVNIFTVVYYRRGNDIVYTYTEHYQLKFHVSGKHTPNIAKSGFLGHGFRRARELVRVRAT